MELEITFGRLMRVWWALFWRNLLLTLVAVLPITFLLGVILGVILSMLGVDPQTFRPIGSLLGMAVGLVASVIPVWLILGKRFGGFRLVLVAADNAEKTESEEYTPIAVDDSV